MAERIVIASVDLDDVPVAAASRRIQGQTGIIDQSFAALTKRMFNLRTAAVAVLGGFTLAGVIFQLSNLAKEIVTSTALWKSWSAQVRDAWNATVLGETRIDSLIRKLKELGNVPASIEMADSVKTLVEQQRLLRELLAQQSRPAQIGGYTSLGTPIITAPAVQAPSPEQRALFQKDLDDSIRKLFKLQEASGLTRQQFDRLWGTDLENAIVGATRLVEGFTGGVIVAGEAIKRALRVSEIQDSLDPLREAVEVLPNLFVGMEPGFATIHDELRGITETDIPDAVHSMEVLGDATTTAQLGLELATGAAIAFAQSFGGMIEAQRLSLKQFFADMLRFIGYTLLSWGALGLVTALFGYGPGAKAAGIALAAGATAILLASQLAPSGVGGGSSPGGSGVAAAGGGGGFTQNISLQVFGNPSEEQLRTITRGVAKALRDGVEGGAFATA